MTHDVVDQMGRKVCVPDNPIRIISLVPSQTEMLADFGLENEVVGITKFCVHPKYWHSTKPHIGGTKQINHEKIRALNPDLIIGNKEENNQKDIEQLQEDFPVWMSDIQNLDSAIKMIEQLSILLTKMEIGQKMSATIQSQFETIKPEINQKLRILYLIWKRPYMAAGKSTFIDDMLSRCGFENVVSKELGRYPEISPEWIKQQNPDFIFLSTEPFPFKGKHADEVREMFPQINIAEVDGELFSWYGSRLLKSTPYFHQLIYDVLRRVRQQ